MIAEHGGLADRVFLVEATVLSTTFPEYEGAVFPACFIFNEDGTVIDTEWPGEGAAPIPGVWIQHTDDFPITRFTSYFRWPALNWTLIQDGIATWAGYSRQRERVETYGMVFTDTNELAFYIRARGHGVETCPL
jgi:hypothetical protein